MPEKFHKCAAIRSCVGLFPCRVFDDRFCVFARKNSNRRTNALDKFSRHQRRGAA